MLLFLRVQSASHPVSPRPKIKEKSHCSHIGVQGWLRRASEVVYWPKMNAELAEFISGCEICNTSLVHPSKRASDLQRSTIPPLGELDATSSHLTTLTTCAKSITIQITSKLIEWERQEPLSSLS